MTTTTLRCLHDRSAVCWLCSDQVPWWREARIRAGMGEEPPNAPKGCTVEGCDRLRYETAKWEFAYCAHHLEEVLERTLRRD